MPVRSLLLAAALLFVLACQPSAPAAPVATTPASGTASQPTQASAPKPASQPTQASQPAQAPQPTLASQPAPAAQASTEPFVFVYGFPPKGGWFLETDDAYTLSIMGVTDTLTRVDFGGTLQPDLATRWTQTEPTTWQFELRSGVNFQDGTPVDAAAVADSLSRLLDVKVPARSFNPKTIASVQADGSNVKITTTSPNPLVPLIMASPNTAILSKAAYQPSAINPIGTATGPFVMTADNVPQSVTLKANAGYWGGAVGLKNVEVRFVPDVNTRAALARSGEAQLVAPVAIANVPTLKSDPNLQVIQGTVPRTTTMYLNNSKPPLNDVRVRQAIQSAVDVNSIASDVLEGAVIPAVGPFAPGQPYAPRDAKVAAYDVAHAKALLADAGVEPSSITLSLWAYPERPDIPTVAVAIQSMLKKVGINVEVRVANYNSMEADALAGNFDMFIISRGYTSDINDPLNYFIADYGCKGSYGMAHFCSQDVDDLLAKAGTLSDTDARYAMYRDLAAQIQSQAVNVFLYHETAIEVQSTRLQNYKIHSLNNYVLTPEMTLSAK
jgi:peptide/nickel transport system substrate-binding protein